MNICKQFKEKEVILFKAKMNNLVIYQYISYACNANTYTVTERYTKRP